MPDHNRVALVILDGWGIADDPSVSAVDTARTPCYDELRQHQPFTTLRASEHWVGLPDGQMGNSEVGHMHLGAGRVIYQELVGIQKAVDAPDAAGGLRSLPAYQRLVAYANTGKPLHLAGLVSDGGVHSHIKHLTGLLTALQADGVPQVWIHAITDGRDTSPDSGRGFLRQLEAHLAKRNATRQFAAVASVCGRYYAMDRDKRWERTRRAYDLLVHGIGHAFDSADAALAAAYESGTTDEFVEPAVITQAGKPMATVQPGDAVLFFNFRTDRGRQLTAALTQQPFPEYGMTPLPLHYATMTRYDETFRDVDVLFEKQDVTQTLGEVLAAYGKTQIRIAETEKYPHVTFFFNGGREAPFPGERRILKPSPKVATYDLQPEMSAYELRDAIVPELQAASADFVVLNFANPDMVGHTGDFQAAVRACETVDACLRDVLAAGREHYHFIVLADHGNADRMRNPDGSPHTAHTTVQVPCILVAPPGAPVHAWRPASEAYRGSSGALGDVAPTVLALMGIPQPPEMTGTSLLA